MLVTTSVGNGSARISACACLAACERMSGGASKLAVGRPGLGSRGVAADIEIQAQEILLMRERLNALIAHHTGKDVETVAKDTDRDFWMSPDQALEYGLVDKVQQSRGPSTANEG